MNIRRVSVGTSFICMKDVVKDIVIPGVLPERRVYCLRKIKIIFICFLRCDVFQAKHQESRCLSQRLSTSFRHMKDVPIASHAKVRRPTVNGPVFIHVHAFLYIYIQNMNMSDDNKHSNKANTNIDTYIFVYVYIYKNEVTD